MRVRKSHPSTSGTANRSRVAKSVLKKGPNKGKSNKSVRFDFLTKVSPSEETLLPCCLTQCKHQCSHSSVDGGDLQLRSFSCEDILPRDCCHESCEWDYPWRGAVDIAGCASCPQCPQFVAPNYQNKSFADNLSLSCCCEGPAMRLRGRCRWPRRFKSCVSRMPTPRWCDHKMPHKRNVRPGLTGPVIDACGRGNIAYPSRSCSAGQVSYSWQEMPSEFHTPFPLDQPFANRPRQSTTRSVHEPVDEPTTSYNLEQTRTFWNSHTFNPFRECPQISTSHPERDQNTELNRPIPIDNLSVSIRDLKISSCSNSPFSFNHHVTPGHSETHRNCDAQFENLTKSNLCTTISSYEKTGSKSSSPNSDANNNALEKSLRQHSASQRSVSAEVIGNSSTSCHQLGSETASPTSTEEKTATCTKTFNPLRAPGTHHLVDTAPATDLDDNAGVIDQEPETQDARCQNFNSSSSQGEQERIEECRSYWFYREQTCTHCLEGEVTDIDKSTDDSDSSVNLDLFSSMQSCKCNPNLRLETRTDCTDGHLSATRPEEAVETSIETLLEADLVRLYESVLEDSTPPLSSQHTSSAPLEVGSHSETVLGRTEDTNTFSTSRINSPKQPMKKEPHITDFGEMSGTKTNPIELDGCDDYDGCKGDTIHVQSTEDKLSSHTDTINGQFETTCGNKNTQVSHLCPVLNCGIHFSSQSMLDAHLDQMDHSPCNPLATMLNGIIPTKNCHHLCPACGIVYETEASCWEHMLEVNHARLLSPLPSLVYACPECLRFFPSVSDAVSHTEDLSHNSYAFYFTDNPTSPHEVEPIPVPYRVMVELLERCRNVCYTMICLDCGEEMSNPCQLRRHCDQRHIVTSKCCTSVRDVFSDLLTDQACADCGQFIYRGLPSSGLGIHNDCPMQGPVLTWPARTFREFVLRCGITDVSVGTELTLECNIDHRAPTCPQSTIILENMESDNCDRPVLDLITGSCAQPSRILSDTELPKETVQDLRERILKCIKNDRITASTVNNPPQEQSHDNETDLRAGSPSYEMLASTSKTTMDSSQKPYPKTGFVNLSSSEESQESSYSLYLPVRLSSQMSFLNGCSPSSESQSGSVLSCSTSGYLITEPDCDTAENGSEDIEEEYRYFLAKLGKKGIEDETHSDSPIDRQSQNANVIHDKLASETEQDMESLSEPGPSHDHADFPDKFDPSVGKAIPSVSKPIPSVGKTIPSVGKAIPNMGKAVPSVDKAITSVGKAIPNMGKAIPSVDKAIPSMGKPITNMGKAILSVDKAIPSVGKAIYRPPSCSNCEQANTKNEMVFGLHASLDAQHTKVYQNRFRDQGTQVEFAVEARPTRTILISDTEDDTEDALEESDIEEIDDGNDRYILFYTGEPQCKPMISEVGPSHYNIAVDQSTIQRNKGSNAKSINSTTDSIGGSYNDNHHQKQRKLCRKQTNEFATSPYAILISNTSDEMEDIEEDPDIEENDSDRYVICYKNQRENKQRQQKSKTVTKFEPPSHELLFSSTSDEMEDLKEELNVGDSDSERFVVCNRGKRRHDHQNEQRQTRKKKRPKLAIRGDFNYKDVRAGPSRYYIVDQNNLLRRKKVRDARSQRHTKNGRAKSRKSAFNPQWPRRENGAVFKQSITKRKQSTSTPDQSVLKKGKFYCPKRSQRAICDLKQRKELHSKTKTRRKHHCSTTKNNKPLRVRSCCNLHPNKTKCDNLEAVKFCGRKKDSENTTYILRVNHEPEVEPKINPELTESLYVLVGETVWVPACVDPEQPVSENLDNKDLKVVRHASQNDIKPLFVNRSLGQASPSPFTSESRYFINDNKDKDCEFHSHQSLESVNKATPCLLDQSLKGDMRQQRDDKTDPKNTRLPQSLRECEDQLSRPMSNDCATTVSARSDKNNLVHVKDVEVIDRAKEINNTAASLANGRKAELEGSKINNPRQITSSLIPEQKTGTMPDSVSSSPKTVCKSSDMDHTTGGPASNVSIPKTGIDLMDLCKLPLRSPFAAPKYARSRCEYVRKRASPKKDFMDKTVTKSLSESDIFELEGFDDSDRFVIVHPLVSGSAKDCKRTDLDGFNVAKDNGQGVSGNAKDCKRTDSYRFNVAKDHGHGQKCNSSTPKSRNKGEQSQVANNVENTPTCSNLTCETIKQICTSDCTPSSSDPVPDPGPICIVNEINGECFNLSEKQKGVSICQATDDVRTSADMGKRKNGLNSVRPLTRSHAHTEYETLSLKDSQLLHPGRGKSAKTEAGSESKVVSEVKRRKYTDRGSKIVPNKASVMSVYNTRFRKNKIPQQNQTGNNNGTLPRHFPHASPLTHSPVLTFGRQDLQKPSPHTYNIPSHLMPGSRAQIYLRANTVPSDVRYEELLQNGMQRPTLTAINNRKPTHLTGASISLAPKGYDSCKGISGDVDRDGVGCSGGKRVQIPSKVEKTVNDKASRWSCAEPSTVCGNQKVGRFEDTTVKSASTQDDPRNVPSLVMLRLDGPSSSRSSLSSSPTPGNVSHVSTPGTSAEIPVIISTAKRRLKKRYRKLLTPKIKHLSNMQSIVFADLENFMFFKNFQGQLPPNTFVWGFISGRGPFGQEKYFRKFTLYRNLKAKNCTHISSDIGFGKDAVDFAMTLAIAKLDDRLPAGIPFYIVSSDGGFREVENQMKRGRRQVKVVAPRSHRLTSECFATRT